MSYKSFFYSDVLWVEHPFFFYFHCMEKFRIVHHSTKKKVSHTDLRLSKWWPHSLKKRMADSVTYTHLFIWCPTWHCSYLLMAQWWGHDGVCECPSLFICQRSSALHVCLCFMAGMMSGVDSGHFCSFTTRENDTYLDVQSCLVNYWQHTKTSCPFTCHSYTIWTSIINITVIFPPDYCYYVAVVKKQISPSAITVGVFVCSVGFQRRAAVNFDETLKTKLNVAACLAFLYLRVFTKSVSFFSLLKYCFILALFAFAHNTNTEQSKKKLTKQTEKNVTYIDHNSIRGR